MTIDKKQLAIIMQNSLTNSVNLHIHNSKGETINPEDILSVAKVFAREVVAVAQTAPDPKPAFKKNYYNK